MKSKILIVEDDFDILAVTKIVVKSFGYETLAISDARQTLETIENFKPDLVLLDIMLSLPDKDGTDICKEIKRDENFKNIPVILYSATPPSDLNLPETGASDFLQKPYDIKELKEKIEKILTVKAD